MPFGIALILALEHGAAARAALVAAAETTPRPFECMPVDSEQGAEFWSKTRGAEQGQYCILLARAQVRLASAPAEALELASRAGQLRPILSPPRLMRARALLRLGRALEAWQLVGATLWSKGPSAFRFDDPNVLHDLAAIALATGAEDDAERLYALLAARGDLIADERDRAAMFLEAGVLLLSRGPEKLATANVYFEEARHVVVPGLRDVVAAFWALSLDRAGKSQQARSAAAAVGELSNLERYLPSQKPEDGAPVAPLILPSGELSAAMAVVAESHDPKLADKYYRAYLADPRASHGAWAEHARQKLGHSRGAAGKDRVLR